MHLQSDGELPLSSLNALDPLALLSGQFVDLLAQLCDTFEFIVSPQEADEPVVVHFFAGKLKGTGEWCGLIGASIQADYDY